MGRKPGSCGHATRLRRTNSWLCIEEQDRYNPIGGRIKIRHGYLPISEYFLRPGACSSYSPTTYVQPRLKHDGVEIACRQVDKHKNSFGAHIACAYHGQQLAVLVPAPAPCIMEGGEAGLCWQAWSRQSTDDVSGPCENVRLADRGECEREHGADCCGVREGWHGSRRVL